MPRARIADTRDFYTTRTAADRLNVTPYYIKSRIRSGVFPEATRTTEGGVLLLDEAWVQQAQRVLANVPAPVGRKRASRPTNIPTPASILGYEIGAERKLPSWHGVVDYFEHLAAASDRVHLEVLGETTDGLPMIVVAVSAAENLKESAREKNRRLLGYLWDPASASQHEISEALADAVPVNVILATQHSNEIGACLMTMELAWQLAAATDQDTLDTLSNTVTLLIPSQNPDGVQMVSEWYARWLGTPYEGSDMPWLYHRHVGHDNNRDWFMLTQVENQHYVELHNREHPQLVFDMHQMYRDGARFIVPPFIDPLDPNQDPVIQQQFAAVGSEIAARLTAAGKAGVATHALFDNYSPSLAYGNYHGSVDLLSEAASCRYATPVDIREADLQADERFQPTVRSWNHPMPWKGGRWTLRDIVEYDLIAARAVINHVANQRGQWLRDYLGINRRSSVRDEPPYAFVIPRPQDQHDPAAARELIDVLRRGLVNVEVAEKSIVLDGVTYPAGTRVVRLDQPARNFAKTLLEVQVYPNLREWPGGPPLAPYDIAGHTLPLQMGVRCSPVREPISDEVRSTLKPFDDAGPAVGAITGTAGYAISPSSNASILAISVLLTSGVPVYRATEEASGLKPGAIIVVRSGEATERVIEDVVRQSGVDVARLETLPRVMARIQTMPRLAMYQSWKPCIDEGWCRFILAEYRVPVTILHDTDIRSGGLGDRFDVIIVPHQPGKDLLEGNPEKNKFDEPYPPEYVGGLGTIGMDELQRFVESGGTLVALDGSTIPIIDHFALPVRNVLQDLDRKTFYCPGSLLRVVIDTRHPVGWGMKREPTILFYNSPAFDVMSSPDPARTLARYPAGGTPNQSGWILGDSHLRSKSALVEVDLADGRVILIGFRPQFRAQARGTYKIFFNAIFSAGLSSRTIDLADAPDLATGTDADPA